MLASLACKSTFWAKGSCAVTAGDGVSRSIKLAIGVASVEGGRTG